MPAGVDRLLDLSFRQLRFESVELIRDICYSAAQISYLGSQTQSYSRQPISVGQISDLTLSRNGVGEFELRHETPTGNRYFLYQGIQVEELLSHESKTVLVRLSFDCPPSMRGRKIHHTGRFEEGMLVALLCLDTKTNLLDVYYLHVHTLQSTDSMKGRGGQGRKAAVQVSFLPGTLRATVDRFAKFAQKLCPEVEMSLVEIPNLLYAGFGPCLSRLQKLHDFAFSELVAPPMPMQVKYDNNNHRRTYGRPPIQPSQPPRYAQESGFEFHLAPIIKPGTAVQVSSYTLGEVADPNCTAMIESMTALDTGQAAALRHSLQSSFSFTQGPPGTGKFFLPPVFYRNDCPDTNVGKSYLGVALTRVLLASRPPTSQKPILVVCVTNHALDSVLGGLNEADVRDLLRIGAGSREEWTNAINLREKRNKGRLSRNENFQLQGFKEEANRILEDIDSWCRGQSSQELTGEVKWYAIQSILFHYHRNIHDQFKSTATTPALLALLFDFWAKGGDLQNSTDLRVAIIQRLYPVQRDENSNDRDDVEEIMSKMTTSAVEQQTLLGSHSIWSIPAAQRETLIQAWSSSVDTSLLADDLARWYADHRSARDKAQAIKDARDIRIMQQANVIGMTTSACASRWEMLNALDLEIIVCEEAGEVLEPHVICSLLPTVQHAVFIGDPQQLRPEVSEHILSLECTADYRLDESLFEKMIFPRDPALSALPMAQLNIQRRMHPDISAISKVTYPFLEDHSSTLQHEPTIGLQQRVFWWDHRVPEHEEVGTTRSHVNQHEVNMVAGLVQYLLKCGGYSQGDIAVLTPYSGQLACLHDCLKAICKIWLNERDRQILLSEELLDEDGPRSKADVSVSGMLRIATVDNFQGEEAKVVILTTVRSGGSPGFLAIPNRINVACSRARNGFYIIGNSQTLAGVGMWRDILQVFDTQRGFGLTTYCSNHLEHRFDVFQPDDFDSIPECQVPCAAVLPCGHDCPEKCHPLKLHDENIIPCLMPCEKTLPCNHRCSKNCGEACGECQTATADVRLLGCGHWGQLFCSGKTSKCTFSLGTVQLECGHHTTHHCGDSAEEMSCQEPCNAMLECGHICPSACGLCGSRRGHAACGRVCGNLLKCGHRCEDDCAHEGVCPPCDKTVRIACEHGVRTKTCSQPTELCLKPQSRAIDQSDSQTPCCLPSTNLPSSVICSRQLACGHECSSLQSEACIPAQECLRCRHTESSKVHVFIAECGHMVDVESLDALNFQSIYAFDQDGKIMGMGDANLASVQPPKCVCGTACPSIRRYRQITKFMELPSNVDTFIARVHGQLESFSFEAETLEQQLVSTFEIFKNELRPGPLAANSNRRVLMMRKDLSKGFVDKVHAYRGKFFPCPTLYGYTNDTQSVLLSHSRRAS